MERADAEDRHLLLVVDGLDEDLRPPGLPSVAALLPATAGGYAHVLVSSRTDWELPGDMPPRHPLARVLPEVVQPFGDAQEQAALARRRSMICFAAMTMGSRQMSSVCSPPLQGR